MPWCASQIKRRLRWFFKISHFFSYDVAENIEFGFRFALFRKVSAKKLLTDYLSGALEDSGAKKISSYLVVKATYAIARRWRWTTSVTTWWAVICTWYLKTAPKQHASRVERKFSVNSITLLLYYSWPNIYIRRGEALTCRIESRLMSAGKITAQLPIPIYSSVTLNGFVASICGRK